MVRARGPGLGQRAGHPEIYADTDAFRVHLATGQVTHFFAELAQHSATDATALVQLVELHAR